MNVDVALLLIRIVAGGTLATHGAQKLFGWFGGPGIEGAGGFMESLGFPRGHAWLAALTEFAGGLGLAVGLLTPLSGAAVAGVMFTVIAVSVHKGFFNMNGGFEFPLLIAAAGVAIPFSGAGRASLDHLFVGTSAARSGASAPSCSQSSPAPRLSACARCASTPATAGR